MRRMKIIFGIISLSALSALLLLTLGITSSSRGAPPRNENISVTEGPITFLSLDESVFHVFEMPMRLDKETTLYDTSGRPLSTKSLKVDQVVTVIFDDREDGFLAKEIYLRTEEDGRIRLSNRGKRYFKKAGLITEETEMTEMEMRRRILPGMRTEKRPGEDKEKGLCH